MLELANATNHYEHFHDIVNTIFKRLQEPPSSTWRQTYKALQLLEYLLKNGSEKMIDATRDHQYELRALDAYRYTDDKGKDQGINVRNRAKEIIELVTSDEKLRTERVKAKENRSKYTGVSSSQAASGSSGFGGDFNGSSASGKKYGGFGSDSYSKGSGVSPYNDQANPGGRESTFRDSTTESKSTFRDTTTDTKEKIVEKPPVKKTVVANLLDMDIHAPGPSAATDEWSDFSGANGNGSNANDDFADFQAAPPVSFANFGSAAPPPQSSGFVAPTPSANNGGFAAFQAPTPSANNGGFAAFQAPPPSANNGGFAAFQAPPPSANNVGFAAFQAPTPSANNGGFSAFQSPVSNGFGNFQTSPMQPTPKQVDLLGSPPRPAAGSFSTTVPFAAFGSTAKEDPFSKLVSLDANSLALGGALPKKEDGPSLNSLGTREPLRW